MNNSKVKYLTIACIGLVLLNLSTLFFIFKLGPRPKGMHKQKVIIEKLGFDKAQREKYTVLIQQHRTSMDKNRNRIHSLRNELYSTLANNDAVKKDSLLDILRVEQAAMEAINYDHFMGIKQICTPAQEHLFNELTLELADIFSPHPPHGRR
jgi:periplasmic protein CpxP/Spy